MTPTDPTARFIDLVGAIDFREKLPTRNYDQPWQGKKVERGGYQTDRVLSTVRWLVVHHTGDGPARPTIQETASYQIGPTAQLPFPGFAYIGFIEADGTIEVAYDLETVPWSQGDGSTYAINGVGVNNYWGIAFCFSGQDPTDAQVAAYRRIYAALEAVVGHSIAVMGHRQVSGTSDTECPGDAMIAKLGEIAA